MSKRKYEVVMKRIDRKNPTVPHGNHTVVVESDSETNAVALAKKMMTDMEMHELVSVTQL